MSTESMKLCNYRMTHDTTFAPNPYFGVLTLATCKPAMRRSPNLNKGDWIAGWYSCTLKNEFQKELKKNKQREFKFEDKCEYLIYLARITDKIPLAEYWEKYPQKRPDSSDGNKFGDNIYQPDPSAEFLFRQIQNENHKANVLKEDVGGKNVFICKEFYYFGYRNPLKIQTGYPKIINRGHIYTLDASNLIKYVKSHKPEEIKIIPGGNTKCSTCGRHTSC